MAYIIIISRKDLPSHHALSYQYILKPSQIVFDVGKLYLDDLWFLFEHRGKRYVWCKLFISSIEELWHEDIFEGYLLQGSIDASEYYCRLNDEGEYLLVPGQTNLHSLILDVVHDLDIDDENALREIGRTCCPVRYYHPDLKVFDVIPKFDRNISAFVQFEIILRQLKESRTVKELFKYSKYPPDWSPYECFAFFYLESTRPNECKELKEELLNRGRLQEHTMRNPLRTVDIVMREVSIENIKVRRFLKPQNESIEYMGDDSILKTDRAESAHQRILADLAGRIYHLGLTPCDSNSLDLFVKGNKGCAIVEVKSASSDNFYRQCLKGAMQIKEYSFVLNIAKSISPMAIVVIEDADGEQMQHYCRDLLKYMDIRLFIYKKDADWPLRVEYFDSIMEYIK